MNSPEENRFSLLKARFYNGLGKDLSLLNCADFNAIKIVLGSLYAQYQSKGAKIYPKIRMPLWLYEALLFVKRKKNKTNFNDFNNEIKQFSEKPIILNHTYKQGQINPYFQNFIENFTPNSFYSVASRVSDGMNTDINLKKWEPFILMQKLSNEEKLLWNEIRNCLSRIKKGKYFTRPEWEDLEIGFELFFNEFRLWNCILKDAKAKVCLFRCHYYKEGMILALKRHGVKTIELQHGLIAPEDLFYVLPQGVKPIKNKALFADEIWVYGPFWKNRLLQGAEYEASQIKIIGYYNFVELGSKRQEALKQKIANKKAIMVSTQTDIHHEFIDYIHYLAPILAKNNPDYIILLKPHPKENIALYQSIEKYDNCIIATGSIDEVLPLCEINISIYSTVIYDALRYGVPSFSLQSDRYNDYVKTMVSEGVSIPLAKNQSPLELEKKEFKVNSFDFYSKFDSDLLNQLYD